MSFIPTFTKKDLKVFNDYLEHEARLAYIPTNTQVKIRELQKEQDPLKDPNTYGWARFWDFEKKATFIKDIGNYKIYVYECTHQTGEKFYLGVGFNWLNALSHAYLRKEIKELNSKEELTDSEKDWLKELKAKDSAQYKLFNWRSQENLIYSSSASRSRAINDVTRFVTRRINSIGTEHKLAQARQQNDQYFCTHGADCVSWKCEVGNTHVKTKDMGLNYIPNIHDLVLFQAFGKKRFGVVVTRHLSQATVAYTTRSTPECIKYKTLHIGSVSPAIDKQTLKPAKVAVV